MKEFQFCNNNFVQDIGILQFEWKGCIFSASLPMRIVGHLVVETCNIGTANFWLMLPGMNEIHFESNALYCLKKFEVGWYGMIKNLEWMSSSSEDVNLTCRKDVTGSHLELNGYTLRSFWPSCTIHTTSWCKSCEKIILRLMLHMDRMDILLL